MLQVTLLQLRRAGLTSMRHLRYLALFLVLVAVCCAVLFSIYLDIEHKTVDQVNSEQMVHADQAEESILRFFSTYNNTITFMGGSRHIIDLDEDGRQEMRDFYNAHAGEISTLSRVDENGKILYTYPYESSTGADVSGQAHVKESMATHRVVISDVFTSVQGFRTIALVVPVFDNGTYRGSLSALIPFDSLARRNLEPIRILSSGNAWLISQSGTILYARDPFRIGRSAAEVYNTSPSMQAFITESMGSDDGLSRYVVEVPEGSRRFVVYEAVYNPVRIGDDYWTIIVATPRDEVLDMLQTFQRDLVIIFIVLVISLILFTYYIVRARGIVREEAKRRAAEEALRESERNYRNIIENLQDVYYRTGSEDTITMVSPSGVRLLGCPGEEAILGRPAVAFFQFPDEFDAIMREVKKNGSVRNFEMRLRKTDGAVITVLANSQVFTDPQGNFTGTEGIIRDITDRKRAETSLQRATRKLNLLTAITTTNIRNAAFTLSGYLELEQQQTGEEQRKQCHDRQVAILSQINSWLDTARNYQDLGLHPPRWHSAGTTFIFAISHLDFSRIERSMEIEGLEIYADPMLETVFLNLAENVLVHARTATRVMIWYEKTPDGLTLFFEDNGVGIPEDQKKRIFEREFAPTNGMGLFMAREILEITGISIAETGVFGSGARFELFIPRESFRFISDGSGTRPGGT